MSFAQVRRYICLSLKIQADEGFDLLEMTHVATGLGAPLAAVLTVEDLDILQTDAGVVLLATSRASGQVTSYALGPGSASFLDATELPEIADRLGGGSSREFDWPLNGGVMMWTSEHICC